MWFFLGVCCGVAKLPFTNNERKLKTKESKPKLRLKQKKPKVLSQQWIFLKIDPLYKCRSVSFYREVGRLFSYRDYLRVKRIETECARLILGSLQLGSRNRCFVTSRRKSRCFSCCQHVRLSGEDPQFFGDSPFTQRILSPETHAKAKLKCIRH
jgi:hypothetical protein